MRAGDDNGNDNCNSNNDNDDDGGDGVFDGDGWLWWLRKVPVGFVFCGEWRKIVRPSMDGVNTRTRIH